MFRPATASDSSRVVQTAGARSFAGGVGFLFPNLWPSFSPSAGEAPGWRVLPARQPGSPHPHRDASDHHSGSLAQTHPRPAGFATTLARLVSFHHQSGGA